MRDTPVDYLTSAQYAARLLFKKLRAVKCPSFALQLAIGKKFRDVLTQPGVLESILLDPERGEDSFTQRELDVVRSSWLAMWRLDADGDTGFQRAQEAHESRLETSMQGWWQ